MNTEILPAIHNLLNFTRSHLRHHEVLMRATGGNFNLFQILGIGHYEVRTHSPILAEFLSPSGRHGQGATFLKLFLDRAGIADGEFQVEGSIVTTEYHIGTKTEEFGGRIDILVQDLAGRRIIIENKIYAGDQENQLTRYRNFDDGARLFYLTLFGDTPSNLTEFEAKTIRFEAISYKDHIRNWLISCRKESACLPNVRESITQYIALIEELTHQSTTMEMNAELIQHITDNPEHLKAFFTLRDAVWPVQTALIKKLDAQLEKIATELELKKAKPATNLHTKDSAFSFTNDLLKQNNLEIGFTFGTGGYCSFDFGFVKINSEAPCPVEGNLQAAFVEQFGKCSQTKWWPAYLDYELPYRNWGHQAFEDLRSGVFATNVKKRLVALMNVGNKACSGSNLSSAS